jgi:hypothetical protein
VEAKKISYSLPPNRNLFDIYDSILKGNVMIDNKVLCKKITSSYPEIGEYSIDIDVVFNQKKDAWLVDLKKDDEHLQTLLETEDAEKYLVGRKCLSLSSQVAQIVKTSSKYIIEEIKRNSLK